MSRGKGKPHHRADTRGGGFTGLPHVVQDSAAYRHCSLWARAVLSEIVREFNGYNNGEIYLSVAQICERLNNSNRRKACRAVAELMEHGLIDVSAEGAWRERQAREFRLTFVASGKFPNIRAATNDYRSWGAAEKINGDALSPRTAAAGNTPSPDAPVTGNASSPAEFFRQRKTAKNATISEGDAGDGVSLHISEPYQGPEMAGISTPDYPPNSGRPKSGAAILRFPEPAKPLCEKCSEPFDTGHHRGPHVKRYCSERCRKAAETLRAKARKAEARA
jgi:hypothetical protein